MAMRRWTPAAKVTKQESFLLKRLHRSTIELRPPRFYSWTRVCSRGTTRLSSPDGSVDMILRTDVEGVASRRETRNFHPPD